MPRPKTSCSSRGRDADCEMGLRDARSSHNPFVPEVSGHPLRYLVNAHFWDAAGSVMQTWRAACVAARSPCLACQALSGGHAMQWGIVRCAD